jgi:hypothetical protein
MALRVYCETLPYPELVQRQTLRLLARHELEVVLAVRPWQEAALPDVARALRDAGVALSVWPMLADEDGRWASAQNAPAFCRLVLSTCDALQVARAPARDVLFDMEPPFAQAEALAAVGAAAQVPHGLRRLAHGLSRSAAPEFDSASRLLKTTVTEVHARGFTSSVAVWPMIALDPPGKTPWQSLLGTPVDALGAGHVSAMVYTSIFEGWSRGTLRRKDAIALLAAATLRTLERWGPRAGVSLGCVGTGAFEDEPIYRTPSELAEDVAVARAAGCERLSLFDLGGVLSREPAEAWLEAFVFGAEHRGLPASKRVWAARRLVRVATWALSFGQEERERNRRGAKDARRDLIK